jgi:peptide-methionine (R)-S-oxide reductase
MTTRRAFLLGSVAMGAVAWIGGAAFAQETFEVRHTDEEWWKILGPDAYPVMRERDTEPPGYSPLDGEYRSGVYSCAGCDLPLFPSQTKFDSGTGWPSFWAPIEKSAIRSRIDDRFGMRETEVYCRRCGGHLGHVFGDGPQPTGLRFCINGLALKFTVA